MNIFISLFFLIVLLASLILSSDALRETTVGRLWRSASVRRVIDWVGVVAGLLQAASALPRGDWIDISLGLLVAAIFARDLQQMRRTGA